MNEFKVGDKVKLVSIEDELEVCEKMLGRKGTIVSFDKDTDIGKFAYVNWDNGSDSDWIIPYLRNLKLVQSEFKLSDIKERWLVKFRNGMEGMLNDEGRFLKIKKREIYWKRYI